MDGKRGFTLLSKSWYADGCTPKDASYYDEVTFGIYYDDGGTGGEMGVKWSKNGIGPVLEVYSDTWKVLSLWPDVIQAIAAAHPESTPEEFCEILCSVGFVDMTETERQTAGGIVIKKPEPPNEWKPNEFGEYVKKGGETSTIGGILTPEQKRNRAARAAIEKATPPPHPSSIAAKKLDKLQQKGSDTNG